MNEAICDQHVEKDYLTWFHFVKDEGKILCHLDILALEFWC